MRNQLDVDWSKFPRPTDDGALKHLENSKLPNVELTSTGGNFVNLSMCKGLGVVYVFPRAGRPDSPLLDGWDLIPGARGCTPQACAFRDHFLELKDLGVDFLFGMSTQTVEDQQEIVSRLHLPFPLLSDQSLAFSEAAKLPLFKTNGLVLLKRFTMILKEGRVQKIFYPVFPPDQNAADVIHWLRSDASDLDLHSHRS